jgi:chemotaxis protein methyltransferase CheR
MTTGSRRGDEEGVRFLQWALPRLRFRWPGFRRVRRQVLRRVRNRLDVLDLGTLACYRDYLEQHPEEWSELDALCRITITRFYRDRAVWDHVRASVLPALATAAGRGARVVRAWSAGCASGEEPYTLALAWHMDVAVRFPEVALEIVATDADPVLLDRARTGIYPAGCLRELPDGWRDTAFEKASDGWSLRDELRSGVSFVRQDLRSDAPSGQFDLVVCCNLAFTYFDRDLQIEVLHRIEKATSPGGVLLIGGRESIPGDPPEWNRSDPRRPVWHRTSSCSGGSFIVE